LVKDKNNNKGIGKTDKTYHHRYYATNPKVPKIEWIQLLGENAYSSDGSQVGKVEAVNKNFIVLKKGIIKPKRYYVPHSVLKGSDGSELFLDLPLYEIRSLYSRNEVPNPANFATLGGSLSYMGYPPIPYMPKEMLKEKYRSSATNLHDNERDNDDDNDNAGIKAKAR
jgi:hypothetical protein